MSKKNQIVFAVFATLTIILASCSKSSDNRDEMSQGSEFSVLKEQLLTLNSTLPQNDTIVTRARWWKYLLVAAADAGGFFLAGGSGPTAVSAGCSVSNIVWGFFKEAKAEAKTTAETRAVINDVPSLLNSEIALSYVEGAGLTHNKVILDLYEDYGESLFEYDENRIIALVEERVALETNCSIEEASLGFFERKNYVDKAVNAYKTAITIDDFVDNLELATPEKSALLEIVNIILEGFDSIDAIEDNGNYSTSVQRLISESGLTEEDKEMLSSTTSVANASARLWNIEQ